MKLRSEYTKKNFSSLLSYTSTAPFHHIKEFSTNKADPFPVSWDITIQDTTGFYGVAKHYEWGNQVAYKILNDTLYILSDSASFNNWSTLYIYSNRLKSIEGSKTRMTGVSNSIDSLHITGSNFTEISFGVNRLKYLCVDGSTKAKIRIWGADTVKNARITLNDESNFISQNILYQQKELLLSKNASLSLSGKSLQSFGITTKQP